jgi:hypothetical protein
LPRLFLRGLISVVTNIFGTFKLAVEEIEKENGEPGRKK